MGRLIPREGCVFGNSAKSHILDGNVSVLHQDEGGIGKSILDGQKISRDPKDFPLAKPEVNLESRGKSRAWRGWISKYLPSFGEIWTFSHVARFGRMGL